MAVDPHRLTFGLPRMHKEPGERRDFLPSLVHHLVSLGCEVFIERGIGSAMGYVDADYVNGSRDVRVVDEDEAYAQDVVLVLRAPTGRFEKLRRGATLLSMLHYPTRPARVHALQELGVHGISLDSIADDDGHRLVVNSKAVAWNGVESAFDTLAATWPELAGTRLEPVRVTVMGAGEIGKHAVEAATKYGSLERNAAFEALRLPGVEVVTIGRNLTGNVRYLAARLTQTDVFVDATQRRDPSVPIVPNAWIDLLPPHAAICDLVVDPYLLDGHPPTVRGIEGIPQGDLDQHVFGVDDPAWDLLPPSVPTHARRNVVSCYSWPGVHPRSCMEVYGHQLAPLLEALVARGGDHPRFDGPFHERALWRGSLAAWLECAPKPTVPRRAEVLDLQPA
jgi:alanine dehydrogenase